MKKVSVKTFVATGIGAALFFVIGRFLAIPVFANTTLNIQYAVLGFFATVFGPLAGVLIGLIGHTLIDYSTYGPWWSWIIASALVGLIFGLLTGRLNPDTGVFTKREAIHFNIANVVANGISWFIVAPILDILIYQEPANKVFTQGLIAGAANIITTGIVGTLLLFAYTKTRTPKGSLDKE